MGFVQTTFLYALAALAIPLIVHFIFRWQMRRVDLGTIRFLSEIIRNNARRKRVKRWLLLAMRAACVALLVALFARPFLLATERSGEKRFVVILVDQSATMSLRSSGQRLLDRAIERAREILVTAGPNTHWELAFFDHEVHGFTAENGRDGATKLDSLATPDTLAGATDYGAAMAWARDLCLKASPGPKDLYLLTDLQRSGLGWTPTESFPPDVRLHIEDLGKPLVNNLAVTNVAPSSTLLRPGQPTTLSVTIFNHGPFPLNDVPVTLHLSTGSRSHKFKQTTPLDPGKASQVDFQVQELSEGLWKGMVQIDIEDEMGFDNQRHVALLSAPARRVVVVDGSDARDAALAESFFIETALRLASRGESFAETQFAPEVVRLDASGIPSLADVPLAVLVNVGAMSAGEAQRLADFVHAGGGLLVFCGENVTAESSVALRAAGLVPGTITGIARAMELPFRLSTWDERHPMLEPFRDPQYGDLRRLAFDAYTVIEPAAAARVLAEFRGGSPALIELDVGPGRVLWLTSSGGRSWSDWPRTRLFVPLVHQMLGDLAGLTGGGPIRSVILEGTTPSGQSPGVVQEQRHWNVVNVSPRESETDRLSPEEFASRFEIALAARDGEPAAQASSTAQAGVDLRNDEIWHWLALCLLALLCSEVFLANRTAA